MKSLPCKPERLIACLAGLGLLASSLAWGEDLGPDPVALGKAEALLNYCAKVAPASLEKYRTRVRLLAKDSSQEKRAQVRRSGEYRKAHQAVDDFVAKVDQHNVQLICSKPAAASK